MSCRLQGDSQESCCFQHLRTAPPAVNDRTITLGCIHRLSEIPWLGHGANAVGKKRNFTLGEIYAFERHLGDLYPGNQNVKPKIRQQLQFLRDRGFIDFVSRGSYRLRS
jgi:Dam-replacing HTH domain